MPELGRSDGESVYRFGEAGRVSDRPRPDGIASLMANPTQVLKPNTGPDINALVGQIHDTLIETMDAEKLHGLTERESRGLVEEAALACILEENYPLYGDARTRVVALVADEVLGLGPIQPLLEDQSVSEIMVNGPEDIYYERNGIISLSDVHFRSPGHIRRVAERILGDIGRRVDEGTPMVDARLRDGSRVNITIPPATPHFPTITIRKFRRDRYRIEDLIGAGTLDERMAEFLGSCTTYKLNILISGGTGSGKTTLLNAMSAYVPRTERVVTIEDPIELLLQQRHVISMEARPPDMTGDHAITQRDLLRNALRMRPDRIIVGEIRGSEAFEMLQAMNTGHEGSLSTVHANSPRDALSRVENMVLMSGIDLPVSAIREQMASALHLIIQLQRFPDGVRRIVKVTEVTGLEGTTVTTQDLFVFRTKGTDEKGLIVGAYGPTGIRPTFSEQLRLAGCDLDAALFLAGAPR